jgi:hypothetical protein
MAITNAAAGPKVVQSWPNLVTYNDETFTHDGSSTSLAVAGTAHGGPTGAKPDIVLFQRHAGDATDLLGFHCNITNYDTTNDEVDYTLYLSDAVTNTKTTIIRMWCIFLGKHADYAEGVTTNSPL